MALPHAEPRPEPRVLGRAPPGGETPHRSRLNSSMPTSRRL
jgi:hypothetical protein